MKLRRSSAIIVRYFSILRTSPDRLLGLYVWMIIDLVLWGLISKYLGQVLPAGFQALGIFLGAVLLSNFYSRVMLNINMTFFEDMWARNFLNLFASPLTVREYLLGLVACGFLTSLLGLLLSFVSAALLFGFSPVLYGPALLPFLFILYVFGIALGILGCAIVLARGPSSEWFIWPIPAVISPFVGIYYPVETLPHWMQAVAQFLPPSYVFEGVRAHLAGHGTDWAALAKGFGLSALYILIAGFIFLRVHRKAIRTGIIARYSAESV